MNISASSLKALNGINAISVVPFENTNFTSFKEVSLESRRCLHWMFLYQGYSHQLLNSIVNVNFADVETLIVSVNEWTVTELPDILGLLSRLYFKSLRSLILYCTSSNLILLIHSSDLY